MKVYILRDFEKHDIQYVCFFRSLADYIAKIRYFYVEVHRVDFHF